MVVGIMMAAGMHAPQGVQLVLARTGPVTREIFM